MKARLATAIGAALSVAALGVAAVAMYLAMQPRPPELEPTPAIPAHVVAPPLVQLIEEKKAALAQDLHSAHAWGELGSAFARQCDEQAQVCFRNAERLEPDNYRWPYLLGGCYSATDLRQAVDCFARAARLAPHRPHVQLQLAEHLIYQGELENAAGAIELARLAAPENPRVHLAQARLLFRRGNFAESRVWAENSAALAPDKRDVHVLLAQIYRRLGDAAATEREAAILAGMPGTPTSWEDPDVASVHELRLSAELASDLEPTEVDGPDGAAMMRLAQRHLVEGRSADAEKLLRKQLRTQPDHERFRFQLGVACFQLEQYEEAAAEFRRVSQLKPDHGEAQYNLGHALVKLNRPAEAKEAFAAAVRLRPGYANARINLAELLLAEGRRDEAREHLQAALRIAPGDRRARQLLERAKPSGNSTSAADAAR